MTYQDNAITIWAFAPYVDAVNKAIEIYQENNEVNFEVSEVEQSTLIENIVSSASLGEKLPDIILIDDRLIKNLIRRMSGSFLPLDSFLNTGDFVPFKIANATYYDGSVYAVPCSSGVAALYYRSDILSDAGVDISQFQTMDGFFEAGGRLRDNGKYLLPYADAELARILALSARSYFNAEGQPDEEGIKRVLNFLKEYYNNGFFYGLDEENDRSAVELLTSGEVAAVIGTPKWYSRITDIAATTGGVWKVTNFPKSDIFTEEVSIGGCSFMVTSSGDEARESAAVDFLMQTFGQSNRLIVSVAQNKNVIPVYRPSFPSLLTLGGSEAFGGQNAVHFLAELGELVPTDNCSFPAVALDKDFDEMVKNTLMNDIDPEQALSEFKSLFSQYDVGSDEFYPVAAPESAEWAESSGQNAFESWVEAPDTIDPDKAYEQPSAYDPIPLPPVDLPQDTGNEGGGNEGGNEGGTESGGNESGGNEGDNTHAGDTPSTDPDIKPPHYLPTASIGAYDCVHCYKKYPLTEKAAISIDLIKQCKFPAEKNYFYQINCISAENNDSLPKRNSLTQFKLVQVYRNDTKNIGYGAGVRLNICERILQVSGVKYYVDEVGDWYPVEEKNGVQSAKNMIFTQTAPDTVASSDYYKNLLSAKNSEKLPDKWLLDGNLIRGFNKAGYLVSVSDGLNNLLIISYDGKGRVSEVEEKRVGGEGVIYSFIYGENNMLASVGRAGSALVSFTYDTDKLSAVTYAGGESLNFKYADGLIYEIDCSEGFIGSVSIAEGVFTLSKRSAFEEIPGENKVATPDISQNVLTFSGNEVKISDGNCGLEWYKIDDKGFVFGYAKEKYGDVQTAERYEYAPKTSKVVVKASDGEIYNKSFSEMGWGFKGSIKKTTVLNETEKPTVERGYGIPLSANSSYDYITNYYYDSEKRLSIEQRQTTFHLPEGDKTQVDYINYEYYPNGLLKSRAAYRESTRFTAGRVVENFVYDGQGNEIKRSVYNDLEPFTVYSVEKKYDLSGRITEFTDSAGKTTRFGYKDGRLSEKTDPDGRKTLYSYDGGGKLISVKSADKENIIGYAHGEIVSLDDGRAKTEFIYDNERRLKCVKYAGNNLYTYTYDVRDEEGKIKSIATVEEQIGKYETIRKVFYRYGLSVETTSGLFSVYKIKFDAYGRILQSGDGFGANPLYFTYDSVGNLTLAKDRNFEERFTYDGYNRLKTDTVGGRVVTYAYEEGLDGRLSEMDFGNGLSEKIIFNKAGMYLGKEFYFGGNKIAEEKINYKAEEYRAYTLPIGIDYGSGEFLEYSYDLRGNPTEVRSSDGVISTFAYDSFDRLIEENNPPLKRSFTYSYPKEGIVAGERNENSTAPTTVYRYLTFTNGVLSGESFDGFGKSGLSFESLDTGNPKIYRGKKIVWEVGERILGFGTDNFTYDGLGKRNTKNDITYSYDAKNRLIKSSDGFEFFYDLTGAAGFVYGGKVYIYRKDLQGSVIAILDEKGEEVAKYIYDGRGKTKVYYDKSGLGAKNPYRFLGMFYDIETGLYWVNGRFYDPEVAKFVQRSEKVGTNYKEPCGLDYYSFSPKKPVEELNGKFFKKYGLK